MRLATVLTPETDEQLRLAAQTGVEEVVLRYPGPDLQELIRQKQRINSFGLDVSVIEGYLPIENIKLGNDRAGEEMELVARLIRQMAECEIPILCYNFMAGSDWVRTRLDVKERAGALVTGFDLREAEQALSLEGSQHRQLTADAISAAQLWENLERFLEVVLPVAESEGIALAMHPDDPPLDEFLGRARIMNRVENFERLLALAPSPSNALCFCQGTFAEMGADIPSTIRRFGSAIRYVHFRDVRGTADSFVETFHDNGQTDMVAAMEAYRDIGFEGPLRPDHVPQLSGEEDGEPGYTILGRLYAFGYIRGLLQAVFRQ